MKEFTLDAKGRMLGRVATEAAVILSGKNSPDYKSNEVYPCKLTVLNLGLLNISKKKKKEKKYLSYSGYPGSQKSIPLEKIIEEKGIEEAFRRAVKGMLPKNKLSPIIMKNLVLKK
jgi:large subunit ribosomal protein L13